MKKIVSIVLAMMMILTVLAGAVALADEFPQPEGGRKYETNWAIRGGLIEVYYEEEGYRVSVNLCNLEEGTGTIWEYNCYYMEDTDTLMSISSLKRGYTIDTVTGDEIYGEAEYEGMDEPGKETVFAINERGTLKWTDGHDKTAGADLEFCNIGQFQGMWRSAEGEEPVWVEFTWMGRDQEQFFYSVYLHRGDDEVYQEYSLIGRYQPETGKLVCIEMNEEDNEKGFDDPEAYQAIFSRTGDGKLLYEAANGIIMEYDFLGGSNG